MSQVTILNPEFTKLELPLVTSSVSAGFPSPAEEYLGDKLDLVELIVKNPISTFFARVEGDSMINVAIMPGDILAVDRSPDPKHGDIVIAIVDGEMTVKRLSTRWGVKLVPENDNYSPINITSEMELKVWGVVTWRIGQV